MFRWCAYCWSFLGESEPLLDYSATHGLCGRCQSGQVISNSAAIARLRPIARFHADMLEVATTGASYDATAILARGAELRLQPVALLMGVLQPALYEVGRLWEQGRVRPAVEAHLTRLCEDVLDALVHRQTSERPLSGAHPVFALAAAGNAHTFGLRMMAFALREEGHDIRVFRRAPSAAHLLDLCAMAQPSALCISVALPEHLGYVDEVAEGLKSRELGCRIVVGGISARGAHALPPGVIRCSSHGDLAHWLKSAKKVPASD
jgi:methanogenic corrinoid protein MtbC1